MHGPNEQERAKDVQCGDIPPYLVLIFVKVLPSITVKLSKCSTSREVVILHGVNDGYYIHLIGIELGRYWYRYYR